MKFQTKDGLWHSEHDTGGRRYAHAFCGKKASAGPIFLKKELPRRADDVTGGKECAACQKRAATPRP